MSSATRPRVRSQWLVLGAALVVLAGLLVAWALSNAANRVQVVQVATPVRAGEQIAAADLTVADVAYDGEVRGLVPEASLAAVVGAVAAVDLQPGTLLVEGMWTTDQPLRAGEQAVGVVLRAGRFPTGISRGDLVLVVPLAADPATPVPTPVPARVIDTEVSGDGSISLTLALPATSAADVARSAATDLLVVVGLPAGDDSA